MVKLPQIKKKVSSFIRSEEGKISKQNILVMGAFLGTAAFSFLALAKIVKAGLGGGVCDTCGDYCGNPNGQFGRGPITGGEQACFDDHLDHSNSLWFRYDTMENKAVADHNHQIDHNSY